MPELGKRYGVPTYNTIHELLVADQELDGVLVSSTHATHHEIGVEALEAGLNVLMEKPMTTDPHEARATPLSL